MHTIEELKKDKTIEIKPGEMMSYAKAYMAPSEIDHHDPTEAGIMGDLYLKSTPTSMLLVGHLSTDVLLTMFESEIDGKLWYELPYCWHE